MDDGKLRAVLTAVERGSFSKAAAELGYTQSAMTHLVNNLEAELGCTLLNRGSHGVRLSEEGEQLLPYINGVIDACDALRQEAAAQSRTQSHQLSLGCFASIARAEKHREQRKSDNDNVADGVFLIKLHCCFLFHHLLFSLLFYSAAVCTEKS